MTARLLLGLLHEGECVPRHTPPVVGIPVALLPAGGDTLPACLAHVPHRIAATVVEEVLVVVDHHLGGGEELVTAEVAAERHLVGVTWTDAVAVEVQAVAAIGVKL